MPQDMKTGLKGFYGTFYEIAEEGYKRQGCDVLSYIQKVVCIKSLVVNERISNSVCIAKKTRPLQKMKDHLF